MFTDQSTDISLGASCRALDAVRAEKEHNFWLAGTCGTNRSNSINNTPSSSHSSAKSSSTLQILQFHSDINEIIVTASYDIDGPGVRKVSSCPYDKELVLIASEQTSSVTVYRIPSYGSDVVTPNYDNNDTYNDDNDDDRLPTTTRRDDVPNDNVQVVATLTPEGGFGANIADVAWRYEIGRAHV